METNVLLQHANANPANEAGGLFQTYDNGEAPRVSARELHERLNIGTEYAKWFARMCEYGFIEGVDYTEVIVKNDENSAGGRPATEHYITIDMAKEICMIQRTPIGKQIRQYFIEVEKKWNNPTLILARALKAEKVVTAELSAKTEFLQSQNNSLKKQIAEDAPKVAFADDYMASGTDILIRVYVKILAQNGINTGEKRLFSYLRESGYLMRSGDGYNVPTQRASDMGLFRVEMTRIHLRDKEVYKPTTYLTPKGQKYFMDKFKKERTI